MKERKPVSSSSSKITASISTSTSVIITICIGFDSNTLTILRRTRGQRLRSAEAERRSTPAVSQAALLRWLLEALASSAVRRCWLSGSHSRAMIFCASVWYSTSGVFESSQPRTSVLALEENESRLTEPRSACGWDVRRARSEETELTLSRRIAAARPDIPRARLSAAAACSLPQLAPLRRAGWSSPAAARVYRGSAAIAVPPNALAASAIYGCPRRSSALARSLIGTNRREKSSFP